MYSLDDDSRQDAERWRKQVPGIVKDRADEGPVDNGNEDERHAFIDSVLDDLDELEVQ